MKISVSQCFHKNSCCGWPGLMKNLLAAIIVFVTPLLTDAQQVNVKGRIINETGVPLANASVVVKGTVQGTTSDVNGDYHIEAPAHGTLVFSSVGYPTKEIAINNQTTINVLLTISPTDLQQVVVVGYGTQKRTDVTGSIASVNEKALREVPAPNLQSALQGKAAGLEIQNTGTAPNGSMQIRIRGTRSITGSNAPLLVLDGIPYDGSINDINPDDVQSIDVLKDASATAIYGSRGANGVIIIQTKRGLAGQPKLSLNGYYGEGKVAWKYPVFNVPEYESLRALSTWTGGYTPVEQYGLAHGTSTNWQDAAFQTASKMDYNMTVAGGSEGSNYSLSGGYYRGNSVLPGIDFTRYSLRATIDTRIGKNLKLGLNTMNNVAVTNGTQFVQYGYMFPLLSLSPLSPVDTSGVLVKSPAGNPTDILNYNPLYTRTNVNNWVDRQTQMRTFNSLYAEYQFIPGLKYRFNLGLNYTRSEGDQFRGADTDGTPQFFNGGKGNSASVNNNEAWGYTAENLLIFDRTIADKHRISFTGLYSVQENHSHNTGVSKDSIDQDFVLFYNLGQANTTHAPVVNGGEVYQALISYMARVNYAYDDRYLITLTYRNDGSSVLAPGHKWHSYPAVSVGWNLNNEKFAKGFLDKIKINTLKLRAGFGQTSNQSVDAYQSLGLVANGNGQDGPAGVIKYNFGPTVLTGYSLAALPNPDLDWEYTKTVNIGLDFGIVGNRVTGSIDYYHQHTHNILYNVRIPPTSGIGSNSFFTNVGEMQNKGLELAVSSVNFRSASGFSWNTDLNLFFNRNKLLKLSSGVTQDIANQLFVGQSMTAIYDYNKLGIWQKDEAAEAAVYGSVPGQLKLEDHSGPDGHPDGVIDANDKYVIGSADAKLQGGMTNRFGFKNFDLSFVLYARFGGLLISQVHQPTGTYLTQMSGDRNQVKTDYWTPNNPSNWFPFPGNTLSPVTDAFTTLAYYDATFVKLRSVNLGYTFQSNALKKISASSARIYATVDNVATLFSPYYRLTGIDPVGTGTGDQSVGGVGNIRSNSGDNNMITIASGIPPTRTFIIGVNVSF